MSRCSIPSKKHTVSSPHEHAKRTGAAAGAILEPVTYPLTYFVLWASIDCA